MELNFRFLSFSIVFILIIFSAQAQQHGRQSDSLPVPEKTDLQQLVNYFRLRKTDSVQFSRQWKMQLKQRKTLKIPDHFTIPPQTMSYRKDGWRKFYIHYSPLKKAGIAYIPSDLSAYYEQEAWQAYQKFGVNAPSLSVVLAQQFTESAFNPKAIGDKGRSKGLPQLYKVTAKWLMTQDKNLWGSMIYFDRKGRHHFHDTRSMVRFPFYFMPMYKNYTSQTQMEGLRRYNGTGDMAEQYAQLVMTRAVFYEEWFAQYRSQRLDTVQFLTSLFDAINMHFFMRNEEMFSRDALSTIFQNVIRQYNHGINQFTVFAINSAVGRESVPLLQNSSGSFEAPADGNEYYLIVENGKVLYDYFASMEDLFTTLNHANNKQYKLYTLRKKKKVYLTSVNQVKEQKVYTNVKPGDKIYLPSGVKIVSFGDDVLIGLIP